jgi:hypothetical protein
MPRSCTTMSLTVSLLISSAPAAILQVNRRSDLTSSLTFATFSFRSLHYGNTLPFIVVHIFSASWNVCAT